MDTSLTLFRAFGINVRVHWSFLLILAYGAVTFGLGPAGPLWGGLYGILVILLLFVCVTLHEFGHALVAKYFKVNVPSITLLPIGGVANLERMPDKPLQEFLITLAGPLVNFAIALVLLPFMLLALGLEMRLGNVSGDLSRFWRVMQMPGIGNLLLYLTGTNILLGLFNLLPAFPMDGGRILRSLLAMTMPYVQATRIAVFVGRLMAGLFALWGIMGGGIFLLLIAFFVYVGGSAEQESVESRTVLKNIYARQALTPGAVALYASERLNRAVDLLMTSYQTDYPVLDLSSKFIGVLTRPRLIQALQEHGPEARVVDVMIPADQVPTCGPDTSLAEIWEKMAQGGTRVVAIKEGERFLGLITLDDITEVYRVMAATLNNASRRARFAGASGESPADA
ncbi:MAG: protease [Litorilinea sp.]|nr:MAG: protease [Litorilinea sp.]